MNNNRPQEFLKETIQQLAVFSKNPKSRFHFVFIVNLPSKLLRHSRGCEESLDVTSFRRFLVLLDRNSSTICLDSAEDNLLRYRQVSLSEF